MITVGFPGGSDVKNLHAVLETQVPSLGWENALEEGMATHSNIVAWRIPWTEEPGRLQSGVAESDTTEQLTLYSTRVPCRPAHCL